MLLQFVVMNLIRCPALRTYVCGRRNQLLHAWNKIKVMVWILGPSSNPRAFDKKSGAMPFSQTAQSGCLMILFFKKKKRVRREQPPQWRQGCSGAARRQFAKRGEVRRQVTAASELLPEGRV